MSDAPGGTGLGALRDGPRATKLGARRAPVVAGTPSRSDAVQSALLVTAAVAFLVLLAGLAAAIGIRVWFVSAVVALITGLLINAGWRRLLVLSLVPATLLTSSALVPTQGRYVPAVTVTAALVVASRADLRRLRLHAAAVPTWIRRLLIAYTIWMTVTTITSTEKWVSLAYLLGSITMIGITFLVIPSLPGRPRLVRDLAATLVLTAVLMVVSGTLLALVGSIQLYGKSVGLYFIDEATIFGRPIPIVFLQNYGPFVGPETTPLALAIVASLYLRATCAGRARLAWGISAAAILVGLLTTFSREGWLIGLVACLAFALIGSGNSRLARPALATGLLLVVIFLGGMTNVLGVLGRIDLATAWYGARAAPVLLSPNVTQRGLPGQASSPSPLMRMGGPGTSATLTTQTLQAECAALASSHRTPPAPVDYAASAPQTGNGPGAQPPNRDTSNDPPGWHPDWGAPPPNWQEPAGTGPMTSSANVAFATRPYRDTSNDPPGWQAQWGAPPPGWRASLNADSPPSTVNGPGATAPFRDTCNDPSGWRPEWGAPPPGWPISIDGTVALKGSSSLLARIRLWEAAIRAIEHSPVVGYGLGTDADATVSYLGGDVSLVGASTHNTFLRVGVENGLPGLGIYVALTAMGTWLGILRLRRGRDKAEVILAASVLGITVAECTGTLLFAGLSFPGFWLAMSVALLAVKGANEPRELIRKAA